MEWLSNLTSGENGSAINLVLITLAIAFLLIVVVWIFRKMTGTAARRAMRSRVPRLSITDSTTVDEKRYLVMIRRDNVEHLLLIGGANDLVVESNIVRAQTSQKAPANSVIAPVAKKEAQIAEVPIEKENPSISTPMASAAAVGTAELAAATTMTANAADTVSQVASDATETVFDTASNITETVSNTVTDAVSNITKPSPEAAILVEEAISTDIEPEIEMPESVVAAVETVEIPEVDLESTISAQLDDALSADALEISASEAPQVNTNTPSSDEAVNNDNGDDEMQRLLNELSGEAKEPAQ